MTKLDKGLLVLGIVILAIERFRPWELLNPEATFAVGAGLLFGPMLKFLLEMRAKK